MRPDPGAAIQKAIASGRLARLPPPVAAALTADAVLLDVPAGGVPIRQGHGPTAARWWVG